MPLSGSRVRFLRFFPLINRCSSDLLLRVLVLGKKFLLDSFLRVFVLGNRFSLDSLLKVSPWAKVPAGCTP